MSIVICSGCGSRFEGDRHGESVDFLLHDCLTAAEVRTVKRAARFMRLHWRAEVARPVSARRLCEAVDRLGVEAGCEEWARLNHERAMVDWHHRDDVPTTSIPTSPPMRVKNRTK
jgi:hypothetical protein